MKKILFSIFAAIIIVCPVMAATYNPSERVQVVGEKLLSSNGIPSANVKFMVVSGAVDNSNFVTNRVVNVSTNELAYAGNDNEVASVVANELGHIISGHASKGKVVSLLNQTAETNVTTNAATQNIIANYESSKQDKEANIVAVNLMVKAGYNPIAMIVVLTKQTGTYWEVIMGEPANAQAAMNIYNYLSYAYPQQLAKGYNCQEYRNFLTYADEKVAERKANKKLQNKYIKTYKKAQKTSTTKLSKFIRRGGISTWDAVYGLLNSPE